MPVHPSSDHPLPECVCDATLVVDHRPHVLRARFGGKEGRATSRMASCSALNVKSKARTLASWLFKDRVLSRHNEPPFQFHALEDVEGNHCGVQTREPNRRRR